MTSTFSSIYFLLVNTFFVTNIFFNSERKSILLNQFVNRPTTVRLNIHVISCDTYDIIYNHWASLLLACILHKVWATTGLTHCYFFRYFLHGKNQERERENANNFCFTSRTWHETNAAKERLLGFLFSFQHSEKRNVLVLNGFLCKQISSLAFDSINVCTKRKCWSDILIELMLFSIHTCTKKQVSIDTNFVQVGWRNQNIVRLCSRRIYRWQKKNSSRDIMFFFLIKLCPVQQRTSVDYINRNAGRSLFLMPVCLSILFYTN
jgi:hypothetical protein